MFKLVLLFLTVSGLQSAPVEAPKGLQKSTHQLPDDIQQGTEHSDIHKPIPVSFRQGTEPSRRFLVNLDTGLVQEHVSEMERRVVPADVPVQRNAAGWVRVQEPSTSHLPAGFRQGTEPVKSIPDGFRQGTEPMMSASDDLRIVAGPLMSIPAGFRQGTEPSVHIPEGFKQGTEPSLPNQDGFRQGAEPVKSIPAGFRQGTKPVKSIPVSFRQRTEPVKSIPAGFRQGTEPVKSASDDHRIAAEPLMSIPAGFRQGTEPSVHIPEGFKQGSEPSLHIPNGFRQGTEPILTIPEGFRQGTEPSSSRTQTVACKGEIINGNCYEFNPTPLAFQDAQAQCRAVAPNAELASVTSVDLQSRLVSLVTNGGESHPVLTWLGATIKKQQASWLDGSEWSYSDWMPGHPNVHTDKPVCVEMFKINESWWTAADCELKRASICSYQIAA
ncbi:uncharacterized protein LOC111575470 [Amphiprion ocellaris]|nr:uncharacterized protein LOC111575470 [Amphiprion ocellaris]